MIAAHDIGAIAAIAFNHPEHYIERTMEIAGDELTMLQMAKSFSVVLGQTVTFTELWRR
jgi:uncharacterized protein YbjT (DUF2867 family)